MKYQVHVKHDRVTESEITVEAANVADACHRAEAEARRMIGPGRAVSLRWRDGRLYTVAAAKRVERIERSLAFCQAATANALGSAA